MHDSHLTTLGLSSITFRFEPVHAPVFPLFPVSSRTTAKTYQWPSAEFSLYILHVNR